MFNDRKAPRFSTRKYRKNIVSEELYERWKKQTGYDLSFQEFRAIWNLIGREYTNAVIEETDGAKLGSSTGDLYIGYVPGAKNKGVDHKTSQELGKKVYHQNWNSKNKLAKIIYGVHNRKYIHRFCYFWSFTAHRTFKNRVTQAIRDFPERYKNTIEKRSLIK